MALWDGITATKRTDPVSSFTWLEFSVARLSDEQYRQMRALGWKHSSYRHQFYTNRTFPGYPDGLDLLDGGDCDYSNERADRLRERAGKHQAAGDALLSRAKQTFDMIPFGQPMMPGHHSYKADKNRRERAWNKMGKGYDEQDYARTLEQRAAASEVFQQRREDPGVLWRSLEKFRAQFRSFLRQYRPDPDPATWGAHDQRLRDHYLKKLDDLDRELDDAGGLVAWYLDAQVGDIARVHGNKVKLLAVNDKTVKGRILEGGAAGMVLTWDISYLTEVYEPGTPDELVLPALTVGEYVRVGYSEVMRVLEVKPKTFRGEYIGGFQHGERATVLRRKIEGRFEGHIEPCAGQRNGRCPNGIGQTRCKHCGKCYCSMHLGLAGWPERVTYCPNCGVEGGQELEQAYTYTSAVKQEMFGKAAGE